VEFSSIGCVLIRSNEFFNEYKAKTNFGRQLDVSKRVIYYKKVKSTQTIVKNLAGKGFGEGLVVIARKQTGAYGRIKKKWSSNAGGLWFSMLLKPLIHSDEVSKLTLVFSIALKRVFEKEYKIDSEIKWPNDVLVLGKKIAGIIIEMSLKHNAINWLVAGVGVNINNSLPKYLEDTSISLKNVLKRKIKRSEFICAFLKEFENLYFDFKINGFKNFLEEYNNKLAYRNENITVDDGYNIITGRNLGADEKGRLVVKTKNTLEKIASGTVRLAKDEVKTA